MKPAGQFTGLTEVEARARLAAEGPNELSRGGSRSSLRIAFEVVREPMLLMLIAAGIIYLALGDFAEAMLVVALASLSIAITIVQEVRSEKVLEKLRDLTSPRALVIRNGERRRIAGRDVVRGDIVVLNEGDRVPADATILSGQNIEADESLLTGESVPVRKRASAAAAAQPGGDDLPFVYSGSLIVRGEGLAVVTATGPRSEIGKIGKAIAAIEPASPPLQRQIRRLVNIFAALGIGVSVFVTVLYGLFFYPWLEAFLGGIALSMSLLPEEFPVILTVFMVMGAWRIARAGVLTRRASAIETLGAATVLCTDKTGTLTENHMTIAKVRAATAILSGTTEEDTAAVVDIVTIGRLASAPDPYDPMERAFHDRASELTDAGVPSVEDLVRRFPLTPDFFAMSNVWRQDDGSVLLAAKGAPEAIAELCRLPAEVRARIRDAADTMAAEGMRVLGVARSTHADGALRSHRDIGFDFLGLVGLADPIRATVPAALAECLSAGIRVVMITGDYPATAKAIGRKAGIKSSEVVTGPELAVLDDATLAERVRTAGIFARVRPDQKLRIVEALRRTGAIVAMTGDGVNDAPSLKAAHIGIAMGGRGTDVAREASAIVLLNDDFSSIVQTIRLGRRIYDNLRKAMGFVMAAHIPISGLALLPLIAGGPLILMPVHIAFIELIIDPICSVAFEAEGEESDVMARPPRNPTSPLFSPALVFWSLLQGAIVFAALALVFVVALRRGLPETEIRSLVFTTLVGGNVTLILSGRSFSSSLLRAFTRPNPILWLVFLIDALLLCAILLWPPLIRLFRFGPLHLHDLAFCLGVGAASLMLLELIKHFFARSLRS